MLSQGPQGVGAQCDATLRPVRDPALAQQPAKRVDAALTEPADQCCQPHAAGDRHEEPNRDGRDHQRPIPSSQTLSLPVLAGMPSRTQTTKKPPGAAKTSTSVNTPTLTVAPANFSVLTPHDRRMTYCVAVPDGPGTTLLTADDASRAISDRPRADRGG